MCDADGMGVSSRVPGPRGVGLLALRRMRRDPLRFFADLPRRYGPLALVRLGPVRLFAVSDPALVTRVLVTDADGYAKGIALQRARAVLGDGLLTSEGDVHRRQLRLIGPALAPRRLADYEPGMIAEAERLGAEWRDGTVVDVGAEMSRMTLRIVVGALLGGQLAPGDAQRVQAALTGVMRHFDWLVTHPLGIHRLRIPTPRVRRLLASRDELRGVVNRVIAARTASEPGPGDLLADLIAAHDETGGMDAALLRDEVLTLMLAGHETTANWLTFTWIALAADPDIARRVRAELDRELGRRRVTLADRERLPYTAAVLEEALRLFPPAWGIGRRARTPRTLGDRIVPRRAVVSACPYVMHRAPALWDEPSRFDPDRWLDGRTADLPRGAFFPFSDGPRRCIGEHFARAEAVVALATLARRWELCRADDAPVRLDPKVTLRPLGPVAMRLRRRHADGGG